MRDYQYYLQRGRSAHFPPPTRPYVDPYRDAPRAAPKRTTPRARWQRALFLCALAFAWCGGMLVLGTLYGTDILLLQVLVVCAVLPLLGLCCYLTGETMSPHTRSWGTTPLAAITFSAAVFGVRSWWLQLLGMPRSDCTLLAAREYEVRDAPRYEHVFTCGNDVLRYDSAKSPLAEPGQQVDMLQDPFGVIAPMPVSAVPSWSAYLTVVFLLVVAVICVREVVRLLSRTSV